MNPPDRKAPAAIVWWIIWAGIIAGLTTIYVVQRRSPSQPLSDSLRFLPVGPLCLACVVRWLVLPRFSGVRAFPIFIIGLALAEACGILGIFLVPSLKQEYFLLSLAALAQFAPLFLLRATA
jgi:hypothetical protein